MVKKAIIAFKKATKSMGLLALWTGDFLYFFLWKNPRDLFKDW